VKTESLERAQHFVAAAWSYAGGVEIFHAQQPAAAGFACVDKAADRCDEGAQMQRASGGGRKAPYIVGR